MTASIPALSELTWPLSTLWWVATSAHTRRYRKFAHVIAAQHAIAAMSEALEAALKKAGRRRSARVAREIIAGRIITLKFCSIYLARKQTALRGNEH
jgi:hypothetical protein